MSAIISRQSLDPNVSLELRKLLTFKPKEDDKYQSKHAKSPPIQFWELSENELRIPYKLASAMFQCFPNWDREFPSVNIQFKNDKLRKEQVEVIEESWKQLETHTTTTIVLPPGAGKTVIGGCLTSRTKLLTAILVYRESLTIQWQKTFTDFSDASTWIVGNHSPDKIEVIICMDTRWHLIDPSIRKQVGCLIIDEAHGFCTETRAQAILAFSPRYIILETATPHREDGLYPMMDALAGQHRVERMNYKPFSITKINTGIVATREATTRGPKWSVLIQSILYHPERNAYILSLVSSNPGKKIGIFTSEVDHAELLTKMINLNDEAVCLAGNKKKYSDARVKVGTVSKIGTGWDEATSCEDFSGQPIELAIVVTSFKDPTLITQVLGRAFRSNEPYIIWLVDNDPIFRRHWNNVDKWVNSLETKVTMSSITLTPTIEMDDGKEEEMDE